MTPRAPSYPAIGPLAVALLAAALTSCAPRYSLHEVTAAGFGLEDEALVGEGAGVRFAYDFWGPEGMPFVALYNETDDTLLVDLRASRVRAKAGEFSLGEVLAGGTATARDIASNYPEAVLRRRPLALVLAPATWTEFYGVPQVRGPNYGGNGRREVGTYRYAIVDGSGAERPVSHVFSDRVTRRLRRREFVAVSEGAPPPYLYYLDRGPRRRAVAAEVAIGLSNLVWLL